jgi:hypothetical protein
MGIIIKREVNLQHVICDVNSKQLKMFVTEPTN